MRIEAIECLHADGGNTVFDFVKIVTDTGVTGWSEYNESFGGLGVTAAIEGLVPHLLGKDPRAIEAHLALMRAVRRVVAGGIAAQAIAAIENALWDVKARALGVPVYELLGGPIRDKIRLYWSHLGFFRAVFHDQLRIPPVKSMDDLKAAAKEAVDAGYTAMKTNLLIFDETGARSNNPGFARGDSFPELNADRPYQAALRDQLAAIRDAVGPEADLMVDLNFNYKTEGFTAMARAAEPFDLTWLEFDGYSPDGLRDIRARTRVPVASGEALHGRRQYLPFFSPPALDVAIIDVPWNGLSESLKIAAMAETAEINVAPHNFCGPLSTMMSAHFCALVPNLRIMEYDPDHVPWYDDLIGGPLAVEDGHLILPEGPGWGVEVDEAAVERHAPAPR